MSNDEPKPLSRRRLFQVGGAGMTALLAPTGLGCGGTSGGPHGGGDGGGSDGSGDGAGGDAIDETMTDAGDAEADSAVCMESGTCTEDANTLVVPLAGHPELAPVGGSTVITDPRYVDPVCGMSTVIVVQQTAGQYAAFSAACTHACCTVFAEAAGFFCPCHGSQYDLMGNVTSGPAPLPLQKLPTCTDGCSVYVQLK